jgi:hypothetical protein
MNMKRITKAKRKELKQLAKKLLPLSKSIELCPHCHGQGYRHKGTTQLKVKDE